MGKNIIICFDGTSNKFSKGRNTSVVRIRELLNEENQMAFYDPRVVSVCIFKDGDK